MQTALDERGFSRTGLNGSSRNRFAAAWRRRWRLRRRTSLNIPRRYRANVGCSSRLSGDESALRRAPHCENPQPNLARLDSRSSRRRSRSGVSGSAGVLRPTPLTLGIMAMAFPATGASRRGLSLIWPFCAHSRAVVEGLGENLNRGRSRLAAGLHVPSLCGSLRETPESGRRRLRREFPSSVPDNMPG
jgi:hypothetical protein